MDQISKREFSALKEQLNLEKTLANRFKVYATMAKDPTLRSKCEELSGKHQSHYESLLRTLN
jgi:hypothetical protein